MKRIVIFFVCIILSLSFVMPVCASESSQLVATSETVLSNGVLVTIEIYDVSTARSSDKTYVHSATIRKDGTTIGIIAITATFRYDGSTVSVVSKSVSQSDTYDGWSYKQNSFTSSGGTVTLDAKLTKLLVLNVPFTMTLSCDKNGNISYT